MKRSPIGPKTFEEALRSRRRLATRSPLKCNSSMKRGKRMKSKGEPSPGSVRDLENILDDLTRKVVSRQEAVCFTCGQPGTANDPLELSHLLTRTWRPTRWDVHPDGNNHMQHRSENQAHEANPSVYRNKFIERCGQDAYDELRRRADQGEKWTYVELHAMILQRESMLRK